MLWFGFVGFVRKVSERTGEWNVDSSMLLVLMSVLLAWEIVEGLWT